MNKIIGIVGEKYEEFVPHIALESSLNWLKNEFDFEYRWIETEAIENDEKYLDGIAGIWSAPGSPFKSLNGALNAIKYAREKNIPHLGTCAGYQHTIIEFARNILGIQEAQHEEYEATSQFLFINRLACSLSGKTMSIKIHKNTRAYAAYGQPESSEDYYCNFGINPMFLNQVFGNELIVSGVDQDGEARIIEYSSLRFFVATLFVPQSRSTKENIHPLIRAFVKECTNQT